MCVSVRFGFAAVVQKTGSVLTDFEKELCDRTWKFLSAFLKKKKKKKAKERVDTVTCEQCSSCRTFGFVFIVCVHRSGISHMCVSEQRLPRNLCGAIFAECAGELSKGSRKHIV